MNDRVITVLVLAVATLVVVAPVALAATEGGYLHTDFETGDLQNWYGFSGDAGDASVQQNTVLEGNYSLKVDATPGFIGGETNISAPHTYENFSFYIYVDQFGLARTNMFNTLDDVIARLDIKSDGSVTMVDNTNSRTMDGQLETGRWYKVLYIPDHANNSFDVRFINSLGETAVKGDDFVGFKGRDISDLTVVSIYDDNGVIAYYDYYALNSTLGINDFVSVPTKKVSGEVVDQDGDRVSNATVKATGYDRSNYSGTAAEITAEIEKNREDVEAAKNGPSGWASQGGTDFQLTGAEGHFQDQSTYIAAHTAGEWELSGFQARDDGYVVSTDAVDLSSPNVQIPADETVVLSLWSTNRDGVFQDSADSDLPGRTAAGSLVVEQIAPGGGVISTGYHDTYPIVEIFDASANGGWKTHEGVALDLSPGFYRVYPDGNEGAAYWIVVGDENQIIQPYLEDLRDETGQLTDRAKTLADLINNGKVVTTTVQADKNGEFSLDLGPRYDNVTLVAYRAPPELDGANVTRKEIIEYYESWVLADDGTLKPTVNLDADQKTSYWNEIDVPASYYIATETKDVTPPADNVTVRVEKVDAPPVTNRTDRDDVLDELRDLIDELANSIESSIQQQIDQAELEALQDQYTDLVGLITKYDPALERYLELSDRDSVAPVSELDRDELETEIRLMNQALYEVDLTGGVEDPTVERGNETVSVAWTVPNMDLDSANVSVLAHYSNGTTDVVDDEYVTIDSNALGDDVVRVTEYPVGENDPAAVQFELRAASDEEYRQRKDVVKNPAFGGELPALDSVAVPSIQPGPNDNVTVTFNPAESGSYKSLSSVTVYGPDGSTLSSSSPSDNSISFNTAGEGIHTIRADVETTDGETFTIPVRLKATAADLDRPPTISVRDSTVGTYALVSKPLESAEVTTTGAGETVTVLAQIPSGEGAPGRVDVHLEELSLPGTATTTVRVVEGDGQEIVASETSIKIHYRATGDSYLVRAHGQPVTEEGTRYGTVATRADGLIVKTWTDETGEVSVQRINNPSLRQRAAFWVDKQLLGLPFSRPIAATPPTVPAGLASGVLLVAPIGLLAGRRRWSP